MVRSFSVSFSGGWRDFKYVKNYGNVPDFLVPWKWRSCIKYTSKKPGHQWVATKRTSSGRENNRWECRPSCVKGTIRKLVLLVKFTKKVHTLNYWRRKWINFPLTTVRFPSLEVRRILFPSARSPPLEDDAGSWRWKSLTSEESPDKWHPRSVRVLCSGWCSSGLDARYRVSFLLERIKGGAISKCVSKGHHGCVGQWGTTRSTVTFLNTFWIMQKGWKAEKQKSFQVKWKASTAYAPGSGWYETYFLHF